MGARVQGLHGLAPPPIRQPGRSAFPPDGGSHSLLVVFLFPAFEFLGASAGHTLTQCNSHFCYRRATNGTWTSAGQRSMRRWPALRASSEHGAERRQCIREVAVGDVVVLSTGGVVESEHARERHVVGGDPVAELRDEVRVVTHGV